MSSTSSRPSELSDEIGKQLRAIYEKVVSEPVPERFSELLKALEAGTTLPMARPKTLRTKLRQSNERDYGQKVRYRAKVG